MSKLVEKLTVTITKTSDGSNDYIQIMSSDMISVNVVLVAGRIELQDARNSENAPYHCNCGWSGDASEANVVCPNCDAVSCYGEEKNE